MKKDICMFMYSHSSYSDAWHPFIQQADKFMPEYKKFIFADKRAIDLPPHWDLIEYDNSSSYSDRMSACLEKIDYKLCIYNHEDMFLYDQPDAEKMSLYEQVVLQGNVDFIRLLRSVDTPLIPYKGTNTLFPVPDHSRYFFTVQPTICDTQVLLNICKQTPIDHLREFEIKVQETCRRQKVRGLFHYGGEEKAGLFHYDSSVYPYIATAIVKGKWNLSGYPRRLQKILTEYKIDTKNRGTI
ncbi:MAG: hypothetical protein CMM25_02440 [Rhodospirillaceae bacterium]|nr:hypothetical protein [Rhodospirillaceae bacterium]